MPSCPWLSASLVQLTTTLVQLPTTLVELTATTCPWFSAFLVQLPTTLGQLTTTLVQLTTTLVQLLLPVRGERLGYESLRYPARERELVFDFLQPSSVIKDTLLIRGEG